jgi:hypothetical protein
MSSPKPETATTPRSSFDNGSEPDDDINIRSSIPEPATVTTRGLAGSLFDAILKLSTMAGRRVSRSTKLRKELERLFLWGDSFSASSGRLDEILAKSTELRQAVLSELYELGKVVKNDLVKATRLLPLSQDEKQTCLELNRLLENAVIVIDGPGTTMELDFSSDDGSTTGDLDDTVDDMVVYIDCLMDLSLALEDPLLDSSPAMKVTRQILTN